MVVSVNFFSGGKFGGDVEILLGIKLSFWVCGLVIVEAVSGAVEELTLEILLLIAFKGIYKPDSRKIETSLRIL